MLSPHDPEARDAVTAIVRHIASETDHTMVVRIGDGPGGRFAVNERLVHRPDIDYGLLLKAMAFLERAEPIGLPASACALVLPHRNIAYIKHGTAPTTTLPVGPNPVDDPETRQAADEGLTSFMEALLDTQPPQRRPTGRPFPSEAPNRLPNPSQQHNPINGWHHEPPGHETRGPRR